MIYYIPLYCYRHFPGFNDIYEYIIRDLLNHKRVTVYKTEDQAGKIAASMLCDDDCCSVAALDFSSGSCRAYFPNDVKFESNGYPRPSCALYDLKLKNLKIISKEKI